MASCAARYRILLSSEARERSTVLVDLLSIKNCFPSLRTNFHSVVHREIILTA